MHPINKILSYSGWQLYRSRRQSNFPKGFRAKYRGDFASLKNNPPAGFDIASEVLYESGDHPDNYIDYECAFAARHLGRISPQNILDIGSYRHFILGLLANYKVTTVDVRDRKPISNNETIVTCDAKKLALPDAFFDTIVSLCSLEHFGLGRYGDEIDFGADIKALKEMVRVLKPGGHLIFTTEMARAPRPIIVFNTHRIYTHDLISKMCGDLGLIMEEERFFSRIYNRQCELDEVLIDPIKKKTQDVYLGCWKKV